MAFFAGELERIKVSVLVDRGCNTNMISKEFVSRNRKWLGRLGETDALISHSRVWVSERALEALEHGNVTLGNTSFTCLSNWLVGTARYDLILGMPWHVDCSPTIDYRKLKIFWGQVPGLWNWEKSSFRCALINPLSLA